MKNVLLITLTYPYSNGAEATFITEELKQYQTNFNDLVLMPSALSGDLILSNSLFKLDKSLAKFVTEKLKWPVLFFGFCLMPHILVNEIWKTIRGKGFVTLKKSIKDYLLTMFYLRFFKVWFKGKQKQQWIIYTYWFTPITNAAVLFSKRKKNIQVISRAHGIDLFEDRNSGYIPFRENTVKGLSSMVLVSDFGRNYVATNYPTVNKAKLFTFPLGTNDFGFICKPSKDGSLSIVSCSNVDDNKRLKLLVEGLEKFTKQQPSIDVSWNHFGDGPLFKVIQAKAEQLLLNVNFVFWGKVTTAQIMEFYKNSPVDVFITTTASEGGRPVSIMEAMSCGVPVIGTAVGGIPELVNEENGILLTENPSVQEVSSELNRFFQLSKEQIKAKRISSRQKWETHCVATSNFRSFISHLNSL